MVASVDAEAEKFLIVEDVVLLAIIQAGCIVVLLLFVLFLFFVVLLFVIGWFRLIEWFVLSNTLRLKLCFLSQHLRLLIRLKL